MSMNEVIFLSIPDIILYKEHILQYVAVQVSMTRSQGEMLTRLLEKQIVANPSSSPSKGHKRTQFMAKPNGPDAITIMLKTIA